jgi:hypothetical protein
VGAPSRSPHIGASRTSLDVPQSGRVSRKDLIGNKYLESRE